MLTHLIPVLSLMFETFTAMAKRERERERERESERENVYFTNFERITSKCMAFTNAETQGKVNLLH